MSFFFFHLLLSPRKKGSKIPKQLDTPKDSRHIFTDFHHQVAGGVHGNNRLGGNSLLDCVVFGRVAGKAAAQYMLGSDLKDGWMMFRRVKKRGFCDARLIFGGV